MSYFNTHLHRELISVLSDPDPTAFHILWSDEQNLDNRQGKKTNFLVPSCCADFNSAYLHQVRTLSEVLGA